ncbi:MAG: hypothetical protein QGI68_02335 [Pseudomonadales bacterium]|nr:hypothetical protein [Pseudomonadales bacterium]MDP7358829.1 hypothetical protein [Pseudomonadales bacterium]MDP7594391.1 hypothetical protein [Pseudomonadales bacterium]HJN49054.1 hypothetical protein [Pseudomonadales bacterium]
MASVRQQIVPMRDFAQAMRESDKDFAERVGRFERTFGRTDSDTLAVLAQACYFCWFEIEYEQDYSNVCRAIGTGEPTSLYLCRQISPSRWEELNSYIVAVQNWLGMQMPVAKLPRAAIEQTQMLLGDHTPEKEALAELFVCHLAVDLLQLSLTKLSGADDPDEKLYPDFTEWYVRHDGSRYSLQNYPSLIEQLEKNVRSFGTRAARDVEELITGILQASQPACQHRFARYQEIKVASIGALQWRGNLPPDAIEPKYKARNWFEREADLSGWLNDQPSHTDVLAQLYDTLGEPTEWKRAVIRDFFHVPPAGGFFNWLGTKAEKDGTTVASLFDTENRE